MTKKDYELLARIIRELDLGDDAAPMRKRIALQFAEKLKLTNPRFDGVRFWRAATATD